jgi:type VI secretion system protein ImpM
MPSVDKAGRYFPLTIAATAQGDWAPDVGPLARFLEEAEEAGRDALELDLAPTALLERIQDAFVAGDAPSAALDLVSGQAAWWTEGGPRVAARSEAGADLPEGNRFAALIDDGWSEAQPVPALLAGDDAEPT